MATRDDIITGTRNDPAWLVDEARGDARLVADSRVVVVARENFTRPFEVFCGPVTVFVRSIDQAKRHALLLAEMLARSDIIEESP